MNRLVGTHYDSLAIAMKEYRLKLSETIQRYRANKAKAEESVSKYRDDYKKEALENAMQKHREAAKTEIRAAGKEFQSEMKRHTSALHEELEKHLTAPMDGNFANQLRMYREFQIAPSKVELQALLKMNAGNTLGLRALSKVLEQTGARQRLEVRGADDFVADVEKLEHLTASAANPLFDVSDASIAIEIFKDTPWLSVRQDGSTYDAGEKIDFLAINAGSADFNTLQKALPKMQENWKADVSYTIQDIVDAVMAEKEWEAEAAAAEREGREPQPLSRPESTTRIEGEGIALAREIGQETAQAAKSAAFVQQYAK